jgi:hypothetical protein
MDLRWDAILLKPAALYPPYPRPSILAQPRLGVAMFDKPACEVSKEGPNFFILVDGEKIAKRGVHTVDVAMNWIVLEPGWVVRDADGGCAIEVFYEGATMH